MSPARNVQDQTKHLNVTHVPAQSKVSDKNKDPLVIKAETANLELLSFV